MFRDSRSRGHLSMRNLPKWMVGYLWCPNTAQRYTQTTHPNTQLRTHVPFVELFLSAPRHVFGILCLLDSTIVERRKVKHLSAESTGACVALYDLLFLPPAVSRPKVYGFPTCYHLICGLNLYPCLEIRPSICSKQCLLEREPTKSGGGGGLWLPLAFALSPPNDFLWIRGEPASKRTPTLCVAPNTCPPTTVVQSRQPSLLRYPLSTHLWECTGNP